jgi:hypothetical protein
MLFHAYTAVGMAILCSFGVIRWLEGNVAFYAALWTAAALLLVNIVVLRWTRRLAPAVLIGPTVAAAVILFINVLDRNQPSS